jgi:peptide/nickel transport system permease protein
VSVITLVTDREIETGARSSTKWKKILLRANILGTVGFFIICLFIVVAIFAPLVAQYGPNDQKILDQLQGPSRTHWFGTDQLGRDIFARIAYGARISLYVSIGSVVLGGAIGIALGAIAGYYGGLRENVIMRLVDVVISFPSIILAIAVLAFLGRGSLNLVIALAFAYTPLFIRITRSSVLQIRGEEYIAAARLVGKSDARILFHDVLANALSPILVQATLLFAAALIAESGLSYVGLGPAPPDPSWGRMLSENREFMNLNAWGVIFPGVTIMLAVLGFNFLGDGLRDILDPRYRRFLENSTG